jgi:2,4-dienoyl-CoA reductase (NADPH2)
VLTLLHHPTGESAQRQCDWVVCAVHQAPDETLWQQLRAAPFEVHRIGDCVTPRRAHAAVIEGHRVAVAL